jgi:hypothetical protein
MIPSFIHCNLILIKHYNKQKTAQQTAASFHAFTAFLSSDICSIYIHIIHKLKSDGAGTVGGLGTLICNLNGKTFCSFLNSSSQGLKCLVKLEEPNPHPHI